MSTRENTRLNARAYLQIASTHPSLNIEAIITFIEELFSAKQQYICG